MSGVFSSPKRPKIPEQQEPPPLEVEEDADAARRRARKRLQAGGRGATILSGIQSALKKRLGE